MQMEIEKNLFKDLAEIIEQGKQQSVVHVNSVLTLTYWHVGKKINEHVLTNKRAEYAQEIVPKLSEWLKSKYGRSFDVKNIYRMMQFADKFSNFEIVVTLSRQLTWSHFVTLIPLNKMDQINFYAEKIASESWSVRETRKQIERKAFERKELVNIQVSDDFPEIRTNFKDPYFLDFLGLKDGYLENDLEGAIIKELELFILELGKGFAFVERQKRMIIDGEDHSLDLLFFNRKLQRLVAVELKLDKFKAAHKGQMELYLKWLDKYERQENENAPIGLILCAGKSNEQIELLEMHKDGIMVAEYWTELPPKKELEEKLHSLLIEARARIENNKLMNG